MVILEIIVEMLYFYCSIFKLTKSHEHNMAIEILVFTASGRVDIYRKPEDCRLSGPFGEVAIPKTRKGTEKGRLGPET